MEINSLKDKKIKPGCSGYKYYRPSNGWKNQYKQLIQAYASIFPLVELNSTFYKLPRLSTVKKWKVLVEKVNEYFIFTVKANQQITHLPSSPTYKKAKIEINDNKKDKFGFFKSTEEVFNAWTETKEICEALEAEVCLFQTPWSFKPDKENLENLHNFFSQISGNFDFAFEPRGDKWTKNITAKICEKHNIIHVVDPLKENCARIHKKSYFRLHGLGDSLYRYKFTNKDLEKLYQKCEKCNGEKIYVLFNNYEMYNDCQRFLKYIITKEFPKNLWGAEAIVKKIDIKYPTSKEQIVEKCGRWWVWITPKKQIRIEQALKLIHTKHFSKKEDLLEEIKDSRLI